MASLCRGGASWRDVVTGFDTAWPAPTAALSPDGGGELIELEPLHDALTAVSCLCMSNLHVVSVDVVTGELIELDGRNFAPTARHLTRTFSTSLLPSAHLLSPLLSSSPRFSSLLFLFSTSLSDMAG